MTMIKCKARIEREREREQQNQICCGSRTMPTTSPQGKKASSSSSVLPSHFSLTSREETLTRVDAEPFTNSKVITTV